MLQPLSALPAGASGTVRVLTATGGPLRRLLDLGLVDGTPVEAAFKGPSGDPVAYSFRGVLIALRNQDAATVLVEPHAQ